MRRTPPIHQAFHVILGVGLVAIVVTGCGSVRHTASFEPAFVPKADTLIEVGVVTNETGKTFEIDIPKMLTDALGETLTKE